MVMDIHVQALRVKMSQMLVFISLRRDAERS